MDFLAALARASARFFHTILGGISGMLLLAAMVIVAAFIGLVSSVRLFGPMVFGILAIMATPLIALLGCVLKARGYDKPGKFFLTAAAIMAIAAIIQWKIPTVFPGMAHQVAAAKESLDQKAQASAIRMETPEKVRCAPPYWIGSDGHSRLYAVRYQGSWECYDKPGYHPVSRNPLVILTPSIVEEIQQEQVPPPMIQASRPAEPVASPAPPIPAPEQWDPERPVPVMDPSS